MVDLTIVNPTKDPFRVGTNMNQPCTIGLAALHKDAGGGTVTQFLPQSFHASGSYDLLGNEGSWSVVLDSNDGAKFAVIITLDGAGQPYSRKFRAWAEQTGDHEIRMTGIDDPSLKIHYTRDNGGVFTEGRIVLSASWVMPDMFIHADQDSADVTQQELPGR